MKKIVAIATHATTRNITRTILIFNILDVLLAIVYFNCSPPNK